ncbi:MAG TPA: glycosyltransferase [Candidatus Saccharimonadales bacterium]|nr:glycosyltransferase [Candidatus Saccharimonadales bacterium]
MKTLTIGIPAYNEEANIKFLLDDLLKQNIQSCELEAIVVASDASSDSTDAIVRAYGGKVKLIENTVRQGQGAKQNQIMQTCDSDVLVLLNADLTIKDLNFIDNLVAPILSGSDLTCGPLLEIDPSNYFEKIVQFGSIYRRNVHESVNNGNNLNTCHGSHRAFSKRFYKVLYFPGSVAEDAYSYLACIQNGFTYTYAKDAVAFIKLPDNLKDHKTQSARFYHSETKLSSYFDLSFVKQNTKWPVKEFFVEGFKLFFKQPIEAVLYVLVSVYVMLSVIFEKKELSDTWKTVASSKLVRNQN